jgi:hypothetical protein
MLHKIMLLLLCCVLACTDASHGDSNTNPVETIEALYRNDLPIDGCDWHFYKYSPTETLQLVEDLASKSKTDALKKMSLSHLNVLITYQLTGKTQPVKCGWNTTRDMDEINIIKVEIK